MNLQENAVPRGHSIGMHEAISSIGLGDFRLQLLAICEQGLLVVKNQQAGIPWVLPTAVQEAGNPTLMRVAAKALPRNIINMAKMGNSTPSQFLCAVDGEDCCKIVFAGIGVPRRAVLRPSDVVYQWVHSMPNLRELFTSDCWELPQVVSFRKAIEVAIKSELLRWVRLFTK